MFCLFLLVSSAVAFTGCGAAHTGAADVVMEVDGQEVARSEYETTVRRYVSEVKRQYPTDAVNQEQFWTTEIDGRLPIEQLMQLAKEDLIHKKTVVALAKEYGVYQETDTYDTYVYTVMEAELTECFKRQKTVSENELRVSYEEQLDTYMNDVCVNMLIGEMDAALGMELAEQAAESMKDCTDPEHLQEQYPDISFYELEMSTQNTAEGKSGGYRLRWLTAEQMQEGEVCVPFSIGKNIMVMRCLTRAEHVATDFSEIKGTLKNELQEAFAREQIRQAEAEAVVTYEKEVLEQVALQAL